MAKMKIKLRRTDGTDSEVEVEPEDRVESLRESVARLSDVDPTRIRMIFGGRVLQDNDTISTYGIADDSTVHIVIRPENVPLPATDASSSSTAAANTPGSASGHAGPQVQTRNLGNGVVVSAITLDGGPGAGQPIENILSSLGIPLGGIPMPLRAGAPPQPGHPRVAVRSLSAPVQMPLRTGVAAGAGVAGNTTVVAPTVSSSSASVPIRARGVSHLVESALPNEREFINNIEEGLSNLWDIYFHTRSGMNPLTDLNSLDLSDSRLAVGTLLRDLNGAMGLMTQPLAGLSENIIHAASESSSRTADRVNFRSNRRNVIAMLKLLSEASSR
jgi:hypothetical protein